MTSGSTVEVVVSNSYILKQMLRNAGYDYDFDHEGSSLMSSDFLSFYGNSRLVECHNSSVSVNEYYLKYSGPIGDCYQYVADRYHLMDTGAIMPLYDTLAHYINSAMDTVVESMGDRISLSEHLEETGVNGYIMVDKNASFRSSKDNTFIMSNALRHPLTVPMSLFKPVSDFISLQVMNGRPLKVGDTHYLTMVDMLMGAIPTMCNLVNHVEDIDIYNVEAYSYHLGVAGIKTKACLKSIGDLPLWVFTVPEDEYVLATLTGR